MQQRVIMTTAVWTLCAWSFVSALAVARTSAARGEHAGSATVQTSPFDGVLRFLAPESTPQYHKMTRAGRPGKTARLADVRKAPAHTHPAQRAPVLAQAGLHAVKGVHVAIVPSYLRSPYPPRFAPQYPEPPFGPPAFTGYDLRYPAAPYVYQYTYQYPYYVYYVVPWPRWPAGY